MSFFLPISIPINDTVKHRLGLQSNIGTNLDKLNINGLQPFSIIISDCVFLGARPACNLLSEPTLKESNHVFVCSQVSEEVIIMKLTLEYNHEPKDVI